MTERFRKANEQVLQVSAFAVLPIIFGAILYLIYLRSVNIIISDVEFVFYLVAIMLASVILFFGIYEVMYGYRIERKPVHQIKRFFLRSSLFALYVLVVLGLYVPLQSYLLPFLSWKYNFLASFFIATILLVAAVVKIPRLRELFTRLEKGV